MLYSCTHLCRYLSHILFLRSDIGCYFSTTDVPKIKQENYNVEVQKKVDCSPNYVLLWALHCSLIHYFLLLYYKGRLTFQLEKT